jgi:hypothetical protein
MPIESILFLSLVIGAFVTLAAILVYADWVWKRAPQTSLPKLVHSTPERAVAPASRNLIGDKAA